MTGSSDPQGPSSVCLPPIADAKRGIAGNEGATSMHPPPPLPATSMTSWQVKMPPILTSVSVGGRLGKAERNAVEATGRGLDKLRLVDLQQNSALHSEVAGLHLNDFFDGHGSFRYRRLGLTFAAKQRRGTDETFGSSSEVPESQRSRTTAMSSAKAFFLATSAKERDLEMCRKRRDELYDSVKPSDRLRVDEVNKRRLEVVFNEIPACEKYFPAGIAQLTLLPVDVAWDVQLNDIRMAARMSANFADQGWGIGSTMNWIFPRAEVLVLTQIVGLWVETYRPGVPILGIDRSTFCRLILDLGLVDQEKVPFYWAVALFDSLSKPMRWCADAVAGHATSHPSVPCTNTVSSWLFTSVLEVIFRALFGIPRTATQAAREVRRSFLLSLFDIAKLKLPANVIEASGLKAEDIDKAITYGGDIIRCQTPRSGKSSPQGFSQKDSTDAGDSAPSSREATDKVDAPGHSALIGYDLMRSGLLQNMLVEPEVLHVVTQHQEVFKRLHQCYADDDHGMVGNMSFDAFRQFCTDFHISPALVSCHFLQNAYESTQCLEKYRKNLSEVRAKARRILIRGAKTGDLEQFLERMESRKPASTVKRPAPKAKGGLIRRVSQENVLRRSMAPRKNTLNLEKTLNRPTSKESNLRSTNSSLSPRPHKEKHEHKEARKSHRPSSSSPDPRAAAAKKHEAQLHRANTKVEGPEPWATVSTVAAVHARHPPKKRKDQYGVFGLSAFVETLFRIAFTYLTTYGNNSQVCASGYIRSVWLVTYLRCVFQHLQSRFQEKHAGKESVLHKSLRRALQEIQSELWESSPMAMIAFGSQALLPPTQMYTLFPESTFANVESMQKRRNSVMPAVQEESSSPPRRPAKRRGTKTSHTTLQKPVTSEDSINSLKLPETLPDETESARGPCVKNGVCRICKSSAGSAPWGNPLCRGCSIVDRFSFTDHIFKKLLIDERIDCKLKARVEMPNDNAKRHAMTPPPMGIAHALRKAPQELS